MNDAVSRLVTEIIDAAGDRGLKQKDLAERAGMGADALSRLKRAGDVRLSTLQQLGEAVGKKLIWVDDSSDLESLVNKGDLF